MVLPDIAELELCVKVWTDGSAAKVGADDSGELLWDGSWAYVAEFCGDRWESAGYLPGAKVNRSELTAIVMALRTINVSTHPIIINTDSTYARACLVLWGKGWRANSWINSQGFPVKNQEEIAEGLDLIAHHERRRPVIIRHVKGHTGIPQNERADHLCSWARKLKQHLPLTSVHA